MLRMFLAPVLAGLLFGRAADSRLQRDHPQHGLLDDSFVQRLVVFRFEHTHAS